MGTTTSAMSSDEQMLACIDPVKKHNISTVKRVALQPLLNLRLLGAKGRLRSEFPKITYSDYINLLNHVSRSKYFNYYDRNWEELEEELQSIVKEYEAKQDNSDLAVQFWSSNPRPRTRSDGTGMGDDRIPFPFPVPVPRGEQITNISYQNSGAQDLRALINYQTASDSGTGNGSVYLTFIEMRNKETNG